MNNSIGAAYSRGQYSAFLVAEMLAAGGLYVLYGDRWYVVAGVLLNALVAMRELHHNELEQLKAEINE